MTAVAGLQQRPNTSHYHFKRAVPLALRPQLGRAVLTGSLGTANKREARLRCQRMQLVTDILFDRLAQVDAAMTATEALATFARIRDAVARDDDDLELPSMRRTVPKPVAGNPVVGEARTARRMLRPTMFPLLLERYRAAHLAGDDFLRPGLDRTELPALRATLAAYEQSLRDTIALEEAEEVEEAARAQLEAEQVDLDSTPPLLLRHYIDPTVVSGLRDERLILLAGRSWRVLEVDWTKRTVWLEPTTAGGKARWMGGARSLGREVCQGIRSVLSKGSPGTVTLSRRARVALDSLTEEIPVSTDGHLTTSRTDRAPARTWTFAGTRANRTLAHRASPGATRLQFDALSVQAPLAALVSRPGDHIELTPDELAAFQESIKFADCLPEHLLSRRKLPRQADKSNVETSGLKTLGMNCVGGTLPSDSCGRYSL